MSVSNHTDIDCNYLPAMFKQRSMKWNSTWSVKCIGSQSWKSALKPAKCANRANKQDTYWQPVIRFEKKMVL